MGIVQTNIERAAQSVIPGLSRCGVSAIHEVQGRAGLLACDIRPVWECEPIAGPAVTVSIPPGDNWTVHAAIEQLLPGDVLVIAPTIRCEDSFFGHLLAVAARARGAAAVVIDAGVRDVRALRAMAFPVWSRVISTQGSVKAVLGSVNVPVLCGGQLVDPGDVVVADDNGICIVPRAGAQLVLERTEASLAATAARQEQITAGELGLDVYGMRESLRKRGLEYI